MFRGYRYRIYPKKQQRDYINQCCGASRFIYNWALHTTKERSEAAKAKGEKYFYDNYAMSTELTSLIHMPEVDGEISFAWLSDVDADLRGYALLDLATAFKNIKKTGQGILFLRRKVNAMSHTLPVTDLIVFVC